MMKSMKPLVATFASALLVASAFAADAGNAGKTVTLTGTLECGKCELHESKTCQNVLKVSENGKSTLYWLTQNKLSKSKHSQICTSPKDNVTVTGTLESKDGKETITPTRIDIPSNG